MPVFDIKKNILNCNFKKLFHKTKTKVSPGPGLDPDSTTALSWNRIQQNAWIRSRIQ
jgi:hypothetical protein